jgi:hypothetical protein
MLGDKVSKVLVCLRSSCKRRLPQPGIAGGNWVRDTHEAFVAKKAAEVGQDEGSLSDDSLLRH